MRQFLERALLCADLGLERGDAAGLVVFAGVELLFERGGRFAERLALLARGDERGDAALKLGARVDRQAALADERAALVDLARDAEQRFAAVSGRSDRRPLRRCRCRRRKSGPWDYSRARCRAAT